MKSGDSNFNQVETRYLHSEGLSGYGPVSFAVGASVLAGFASILLGSPIWFASYCLFSNRRHWSQSEICSVFPPLGFAGWAFVCLAAVALGLSYVFLYRRAIKSGWYISLSVFRINAANLYAIVLGHILGLATAIGFGDPKIVGFEWVVIAVSGPLLARALWGASMRWMLWMAQRVPRAASLAAIQYLLYQTFTLRRSEKLDVSIADNCVKVIGPVDAVDEKRIRDIVLRYAEDRRLNVKVETTLTEDEYWLPYIEELGPSGRASGPIPRTDLIDNKWVVVAIAIPLLIWLAVFWATGFKVMSLKDLEAGIRDMFETRGLAP